MFNVNSEKSMPNGISSIYRYWRWADLHGSGSFIHMFSILNAGKRSIWNWSTICAILYIEVLFILFINIK